MPLPKTQDVGKIMHKLKGEGGRSRDQMIAIALTEARKNGADVPLPSKKNIAMKMRADKMKK